MNTESDTRPRVPPQLRRVKLIERTDALDWGTGQAASAWALGEPRVTDTNERLFRTHHPSLKDAYEVWKVYDRYRTFWSLWGVIDPPAHVTAGDLPIHLLPPDPRGPPPRPQLDFLSILRIDPRRLLDPVQMALLRLVFPLSYGVEIWISGIVVLLYPNERAYLHELPDGKPRIDELGVIGRVMELTSSNLMGIPPKGENKAILEPGLRVKLGNRRTPLLMCATHCPINAYSRMEEEDEPSSRQRELYLRMHHGWLGSPFEVRDPPPEPPLIFEFQGLNRESDLFDDQGEEDAENRSDEGFYDDWEDGYSWHESDDELDDDGSYVMREFHGHLDGKIPRLMIENPFPHSHISTFLKDHHLHVLEKHSLEVQPDPRDATQPPAPQHLTRIHGWASSVDPSSDETAASSFDNALMGRASSPLFVLGYRINRHDNNRTYVVEEVGAKALVEAALYLWDGRTVEGVGAVSLIWRHEEPRVTALSPSLSFNKQEKEKMARKKRKLERKMKGRNEDDNEASTSSPSPISLSMLCQANAWGQNEVVTFQSFQFPSRTLYPNQTYSEVVMKGGFCLPREITQGFPIDPDEEGGISVGLM